MKKLTFIFVSFLLIFRLNAQEEVFFVEYTHDSIKIWNTHAFEECAFVADFEVKILADTITVIEQDTFAPAADCLCYFDFCVTLDDNIGPGDYTVMFYRQLYGGQPHFVGSTTFTDSTGFSLPPVNMKFFQSECYEINDIVEKNAGNTSARLRSQPNPFTGYTTLTQENRSARPITQRKRCLSRGF